MRSTTFPFLLILVGVFALATTPASAQATRTWVSGVGDDANPCSRTAPCKTFAGAIAKTAASGEIDCLDSGGFGALTITKAISIVCEGVIGGVSVPGTNGINVAAASTDTVVLQGLDIDGAGSGINGVNFTSGLQLYVIRCTIRRFTGNGVNVTSSTLGGHAFINDSTIQLNAGGVNVQGTSNVGSVTNTYILSNTSFGVQANGTGNVVGVQNSTLNNNGLGISLLNGGAAVSVGPSNLVTNGGTFTSTIPFK
jgi:hypothetical protein